MSVAMAPLLYTSTVNEKLYSCDDKGAHAFLGKMVGRYRGGIPRGI